MDNHPQLSNSIHNKLGSRADVTPPQERHLWKRGTQDNVQTISMQVTVTTRDRISNTQVIRMNMNVSTMVTRHQMCNIYNIQSYNVSIHLQAHVACYLNMAVLFTRLQLKLSSGN